MKTAYRHWRPGSSRPARGAPRTTVIEIMALKKPRPLRRDSPEGKASAAAKRRGYLALMLGAALGAGLFSIWIMEEKRELRVEERGNPPALQGQELRDPGWDAGCSNRNVGTPAAWAP